MQPRFEIVVSIEESKDNENMSLEELQGSLEAHELRTNERSLKRSSNEALQAQRPRKKLGTKTSEKKGEQNPTRVVGFQTKKSQKVIIDLNPQIKVEEVM